MNFKLIFICLFFVSACGVKGRPIPPKASKLPDITDSYRIEKKLDSESIDESKDD